MEDRAVVPALLRRLNEIRDLVRCDVGGKIDDHRSRRCFDHGLFWCVLRDYGPAEAGHYDYDDEDQNGIAEHL